MRRGYAEVNCCRKGLKPIAYDSIRGTGCELTFDLVPGSCCHYDSDVKRTAVAFLLTIAWTASTFAASDTASRAQSLIEQATAAASVLDSPGLRMTARVRIDNEGKPLEGTYSLLRNGLEQWREEITFPGYSEVRVGTNGVIYLKRSSDFEPYRVSQLRGTLGLGARLHPGAYPGEAIKKIREEKIGGEKADCIEFASEQGHKRDVCVDEATGMLKRDKQGFVDSDFQPVGTKLFPRSMSLKQNGKVIVEVAITELSTGNAFPVSLFQPVQGAISTPGCFNPMPAHRTNNVLPRYPEADKAARIQGTVALYGKIGTDGKLRDLTVVSGVTPSLNESALTSLAQWEFAPATCNSNPVETEIVFEIHYQMGG